MENKKVEKKNTGLIIILILIILGLVGYIVYDKVLEKDNKKEFINDKEVNVNENNNQIAEYNKEELLSLLDGVWYNCETNSLGNKECYVRIFSENTFQGGIYGAGAGYGGEITFFAALENNKYTLITYNPGCHGNDCMDEKDSEYYTVIVDITNISNKTITINDVVVKYAAEDMDKASKIITEARGY